MKGLYIHIPFCESICPYCDFSTWKASERQHQRWFEVMKLELKSRCVPKTRFDTLYFGGGTPSLISANLFEKVMVFLKDYLELSYLIEVTVEANPNGVDLEKLKTYQNCGVTRISLGVQSFQNRLLKELGRKHSREDIEFLFNKLDSFNFQISVDLMFGTPLQGMFDLISDVKIATDYPISHLSLYGLMIEPQTLFHQRKQKKTLPKIREDLYDQMYLTAVKILEKKGFFRYEVSSFSRFSLESVHNKNYWNNVPFLGIGPGAYSFLNNFRSGNSKKFATYEKWVLNGCVDKNADFYERVNLEMEKRERVWLFLRQQKGLNVKQFLEDTNDSLARKEILNSWVKKNYAVIEKDYFRLKNLGWLYIDDVVMDLWNKV